MSSIAKPSLHTRSTRFIDKYWLFRKKLRVEYSKALSALKRKRVVNFQSKLFGFDEPRVWTVCFKYLVLFQEMWMVYLTFAAVFVEVTRNGSSTRRSWS